MLRLINQGNDLSAITNLELSHLAIRCAFKNSPRFQWGRVKYRCNLKKKEKPERTRKNQKKSKQIHDFWVKIHFWLKSFQDPRLWSAPSLLLLHWNSVYFLLFIFFLLPLKFLLQPNLIKLGNKIQQRQKWGFEQEVFFVALFFLFTPLLYLRL